MPPDLEQVSAYRTTKEVFGAERTIVVTFNDNLYTAQLTTLTEQITKCRSQLHAIQTRLDRHRNRKSKEKRPTVKGTENRVKAVLKARHMSEVLNTRVFKEKGHVANGTRLSISVVDTWSYGTASATVRGRGF